MKEILFLFAATAIFVACSKKESAETKENPCPVIDKGSVPATVKSSFQTKYPANSVITWFKKDNVGYCAYFKQAAVKKLAEFDNAGLFLREETDNDKDENHDDDSTAVNGPKGASGCECEIPE